MKRIIAIGMLYCSSFLCAMELNELKIIINGTAISVIQDNPYKPERNYATITITGARQQEPLYEPCLRDLGANGDIGRPFFGNYVYTKKDLIEKKDLIKLNENTPPSPNPGVDCIKWEKTLLSVTEPRIFMQSYHNILTWHYYSLKRIDKDTIEDTLYRGEQALVEAKLDLAFCYKKILEQSLHNFSIQQNKNLILPSISTSTLNNWTNLPLISNMPHKDAASIACLKILSFVTQEENKEKYNLIELIVGQNDFPFYHNYFKRFQELIDADPVAIKDSSYYAKILKKYEEFLKTE